MYKNAISALVLFLFFLLPQTASAHYGNGPPFMKVDGIYAQTNPYNQGLSTLSISWDNAPGKYFIKKPVSFEIDIPVLLAATTVPKEYLKDVTIRWSVATGDNFENKDTNYTNGAELTKTFTKPGSYMVITEAKLPADSDFILINTVQVDILPSDIYKTPAPSAYVGTQYDDPRKNILLVSDTVTDPSTKIKKYLWDFGDGRLREGAVIDRNFQKVSEFGTESVFHRVVDENGFIADMGFVVNNIENKLRFDPFVSGKPLPVIVVTRQEAEERAGKTASLKLTLPQFAGLAAGVFILAGLVWWRGLKKKKSSR